MADLPKGAARISPSGARPAVKDKEESFVTGVARQFVGGLEDITDLIASPLESTFGTVLVGPGGVEFLGPTEVRKRKQTGDFPRLGGGTREQPTDIFGASARFAGQTAALAGPVGRLAGTVAAPTAAATRVGRVAQFPQKIVAQAGQTFAKSPVATTAVETGFGATAGAGGFVASKIFPDSDAAEIVGQLVGGTAPALTPTGLLIRTSGGIKNALRILRHPFTEIGGRQRAAARAQRSVPIEKREEVLKQLEKETTIDPETGKPVLTPGQRTGEPGLLSLERAVMESSEELTRISDLRISHANEVIQRSLVELGDPSASAIPPIKEAQRYLDNLLDTRLRISAQRVDERILELGPKASREQANLVAREEIEKALLSARLQEKELFDVIPETTAVPFREVKATFNSFLKELGKPQHTDIPDVAKQFLGDKSKDFFGKHTPAGFKKDETTIREMRSLQSKLRAEARNARSGDKKNLNMARIADDLADSITEDLAKAAAGPEVSDAISMAVGFSRNLNERFSTGTVAKILGRTAIGDRVPPGLTLEQSIGISGPKAREALDDLIKAFDSPEAPKSELLIESAKDYFRSRFMLAAVERGQLNMRAAQRFIKQNDEVLKRLPDLKSQIDEVIESGELLEFAKRQRSRVSFDDPRISKATMLIEKGPVETFRQISKLKPDQAAKEIQQLINRVSSDQTGEALSGLKAGFIEFIMSGARTSARDVRGAQFVSGFALRDALVVPGTRSAANRLFSNDELKRIGIITRDLINLEKRRTAAIPQEGIIGDKPSKLLETVAGIAGAAVGRSEGRRLGVGGTVQIPGIMANRFREMVKVGVKDPASRLIRDAVEDEELFKELLMAPITENGLKLSRQAERRLNVWAVTVLAEQGGAFDER